jgi:ethanolamine utilization cobalamin adenosyltransferase
MSNLYNYYLTNTNIKLFDNNHQHMKDINKLIKYIETLLNGEYVNNSLESYSTMLYDSDKQVDDIIIQNITDNIYTSERHYVPLIDINTETKIMKKEFLIPNDYISQVYFASISVLGLFILYRLVEKSK